MTNLVSTPGQTLSNCEESHDVYGNSCTNDTDCHSGRLVMTGSGIQTGRCVPSTRQKNLKVCEIYGWCPTEHDITPRPHLLSTAENFTVILKNSIEFPRYRVKRRNILYWMDKLYLKTCRYNPHDERMKFCPIFRLGDILKYSDATNKDIWQNGGMVSIHIEWNCNLDFDVEKCVPKYVFRRLDDFESPVAKGWNFRFSQHYMENGVRKRNLIKAYGIQFFISVYGTGGKFNVLTFSMNLGSGLALLGIATVLCDMIVLNITRKRGLYRKAKVDLVAQKKRERQTRESLSRKSRVHAESGGSANQPCGSHSNGEVITSDEEISPQTLPKRKGKNGCSKKVECRIQDNPVPPNWVDRSCPNPNEQSKSDESRQKDNHIRVNQASFMGVQIVTASPDLNQPSQSLAKTSSNFKNSAVSPRENIESTRTANAYLPKSVTMAFGPPSIRRHD
ncbi:Purinergic receptor P2X ligand-gated ion channel 4 isoform CRAc [Fasciola gigantica]|uniref:Purinergic receptor P2X ligand-gated ion channel 4 isoform CRAc n=1 Tax=Fasciola gigantica TaxID=46835 RepID=A0A504Y711_FASGI|nr:Purinergic receptor P2X ligand-gated ion channel 4 isoform CRAc [Fasciola gigantica]